MYLGSANGSRAMEVVGLGAVDVKASEVSAVFEQPNWSRRPLYLACVLARREGRAAQKRAEFAVSFDQPYPDAGTFRPPVPRSSVLNRPRRRVPGQLVSLAGVSSNGTTTVLVNGPRARCIR
jgi:hypothetical protein